MFVLRNPEVFSFAWFGKKEKKEKTFRIVLNKTVTDRRQRPVNISKSDQSGADPRETQEKGCQPVRDTVHHHERGTLWQQQA